MKPVLRALSMLLLSARLENAALHADSGDTEAEAATIDRASRIARALVAELSTVEGAADLVSTTYFCGRDLLYPDDRERMVVLRAFLGDHLGAAREAWPERWRVPLPDPDDPDIRSRSRRRAESWVQLAKAQTCERMGEEGRANSLVEAILVSPPEVVPFSSLRSRTR